MLWKKKKNKFQCFTTVDEYGVIAPTFQTDGGYTSGYLKYFFPVANKKVRVTIEVID